MSNEPAVTAGVIGTVVTAVITLAVSFGAHFTAGQTSAILGVVAALGPVLTALGVRGYVTPTSTVATLKGAPTSFPASKSSAMP